jgi:hypothetical protein
MTTIQTLFGTFDEKRLKEFEALFESITEVK